MRAPLARRVATLAAAALTAVTLLVGAAPPAGSDPVWAPASQATIRPGVQMVTNGGQCTANFVFTRGSDVYLGYAAHCAGTGAATDTNGCDAGTLPLGTPVEIQGASRPGTLAYSSWVAMQSGPRPAEEVCQYNDFAVVRIHPDDHDKVNPSIPHWGGPTGLNTSGTAPLERVFSYGNSSLRLGLELLSPKTGLSLGGSEWSHPIYTVTPGIPGDSGSAILDSQGRAVGVLSTLGLLPLPLSNNASDLESALAYAQSHGMSGLTLALGTEPFRPNQLPLRL
ncbi:MAG TPA: hypothetical protein VK007_06825 [Acidimicrobiales bacterium]|nr:hypothetical protein [Acidimicrobiales bacterium]